MGDIIEAAKFLIFPQGVPYEIKSKEVLQPNGSYIDHLLDMKDTGVDPLMHILLTVELNGRNGSDEFYLNTVAEFFKNGKIDYGLWNVEESRNRFDRHADLVDLPLPKAAYFFLGHDMVDYLREGEPTFKYLAQLDLKEQQAGHVPKREIDFALFRKQLETYSILR